MKRTAVLISISIVVFLTIQAHGFINKRYDWWKLRAQKLTEQLRIVKSNPDIDPSVRALIDDEIKSANAFIQIFESLIHDDGSLNNTTRRYSGEEIKTRIDSILSPIFSVYYLQTIVNDTGNADNFNKTKDTVKKRVRVELGTRRNTGDDELVSAILADEISTADWKNFSMELFIGDCMMNRNTIKNNILKELLASLNQKLEGMNFVCNDKMLNDMITSSVMNYFKKNTLNGRLEDGNSLDESWSWKRFHLGLKKNMDISEHIRAMKNDGNNPPFLDSTELYKKPIELDAFIFDKNHSGFIIDETITEKPVTGNESPAVVMEIPDEPDMDLIMNEIDNLRREKIISINGKEDSAFFDEFRRAAARIISEKSETTADHFFREKERARILMEQSENTGNGSQVRIANEDTFQHALTLFEKKISLVKKYQEKSTDFLRWYSGTKKIDADFLVAQYRYQMDRNTRYLDFIKELVEKSRGIATLRDPYVHAKFSQAVTRSDNLFKFMNYSIAPEKEYITFLNTAEIKKIKEMQSLFSHNSIMIRHDISKTFKLYSADRDGLMNKGRTDSKSLMGKVAQQEIDLLCASAEKYSKLHDSLRYDEDALSLYLERYNEFCNILLKGEASGQLEYSLRMKSIIPGLENFDENRLCVERSTKNYLKKEGQTAIARLLIMIDFYRRQKINIEITPSGDEIAAMKKILNRKCIVAISTWPMNESNYKFVDQKAAQRLQLMYNRFAVKHQMETASEISRSSEEVRINDLDLSLFIPQGWREEAPGDVDKSMGMIRCFSNRLFSSRIGLVQIPVSGTSVADASKNIIKKFDTVFVKGKWGKKDKLEYYWGVAKNKSMDILETYAFEKNNFIFIITGRTSREKYPFLKKTMDTVFNSVQY